LRGLRGAGGEPAGDPGRRVPAVPAHADGGADRDRRTVGRGRPGLPRRLPRLRERTPDVWRGDLKAPGDPVQAGRHGDGGGGRADDRVSGRGGVRARGVGDVGRGPAAGGDVEALRVGGVEAGGGQRRADPRGVRVHGGLPRGAVLAGREGERDRGGDLGGGVDAYQVVALRWIVLCF